MKRQGSTTQLPEHPFLLLKKKSILDLSVPPPPQKNENKIKEQEQKQGRKKNPTPRNLQK